MNGMDTHANGTRIRLNEQLTIRLAASLAPSRCLAHQDFHRSHVSLPSEQQLFSSVCQLAKREPDLVPFRRIAPGVDRTEIRLKERLINWR